MQTDVFLLPRLGTREKLGGPSDVRQDTFCREKGLLELWALGGNELSGLEECSTAEGPHR